MSNFEILTPADKRIIRHMDCQVATVHAALQELTRVCPDMEEQTDEVYMLLLDYVQDYKGVEGLFPFGGV